MKITLISDTHNKHTELDKDLIGGDLILHAGDFLNARDYTSSYYLNELKDFCAWYSKTPYDNKIFIAGNHDFCFVDDYEKSLEILKDYNITYLQDNYIIVNNLKIYGSPWQPSIYDWAFSLPKNSKKLENIWNKIPDDTDIILTHAPAYGILDDVFNNRGVSLGCEFLAKRLNTINPILHLCGHIHSSYGSKKINNTWHYNASVLDEDYKYQNYPINIEIIDKMII